MFRSMQARIAVQRHAVPVIALALLCTNGLHADVAPPVKVTIDRNAAAAVATHAYSGTFVLNVGEPGVLSDFALTGDGWTVLSASFPAAGHTPAGLYRIPFSATPTDPDAPLTLHFRYDGRHVRRAFEFGPASRTRIARMGRTRVVAIGKTPLQLEADGQPGDQPPPRPRDGAIPLRFRGRFVYQRSDGAYVGADNIRVWVFDDDGAPGDALVDEQIWEGITDQNGYFDSGVIMWDDCDIVGCDDPDIYVHFECDTAIAQVQTAGLEIDYFWRTMDNIIEDFTGTEIDFGTLAPGDPSEQAAVHIWNSIIRAHRFILDRGGINLPIVDVQWPESTNGAYYNPFYEEIHIGPDRTWNESTHTHEFGHHFLENRAVNPTPDYCNGFCDGDADACDFDGDCPDEGHCTWCPETDHDAFNEGWPDWLGDVVVRDYPNRYTFDDGSPYLALNPRSYESPNVCCVDDMPYSPVLTEGFVAALLRDIEDPDQDDHDGDGIRDIMCLGPEEIIAVTDIYEPVTVLDFLAAFRTHYPQHLGDLRATAFNVGGTAYTAGFPADNTPPGDVAFLDSTTHPLGLGGSLPCIWFQFNAAPDAGSGATTYSYVFTTDPAGEAPDQMEDPVWNAGDCQLAGAVAPFTLGQFYISIKACDSVGNWAPTYATFGPFEILDCNNSGFLDACDINCCDAGCDIIGPDNCSAGAVLCPTGACGISSDCNDNDVPDECDIASGTSDDCNGDGIPDECQQDVIKHFSGAVDTDWHNPANWLEAAVPVNDDAVCVAADVPASPLSYRRDYTRLSSLNCATSFSIASSSFPWPDLELTGPSLIAGDLTLAGASSTLRNNDDLIVTGAFNWAGGILRGAGTTSVLGGMNLTSQSVSLYANHHLLIAAGPADAGNRRLVMQSNALLTINDPVTYTYAGDSYIFDGSPSSLIAIDGALLRTSGAGAAYVASYVDNAGLIHNQSGTLSLSFGGQHSGAIRSDAGTTLILRNNQELLPSSTLTVDDLELRSGTNATLRGAVDIAGTLTVDGGTWTFTNEASVASYGHSLSNLSGTVHFQSPSAATVDFPDVLIGQPTIGGSPHFDTGAPVLINNLNFRRGTLYGADPLTIDNNFTWAGGNFSAGGPVTSTGTLIVSATSSARSTARILNNTGPATFSGRIAASGAGAFNNSATGVVELLGDNTGFSGGNITNAGLIIKSTGPGEASVSSHITNTGTIRVQAGALYLGYVGGENAGSIIGDPGTTLILAGSHEMLPGSSLTADNLACTLGNTSNFRGAVDIAGTLTVDSGAWIFTNEATPTSYGQNLHVNAGTLRLQAPLPAPTLDFLAVSAGGGTLSGVIDFATGQPVTIDTLTLVRGNLTGASTITVTDLTWNSGTFNSGGPLTVTDSLTINSNGNTRNLQRDLYNAGVMTFLNGSISASNADVINTPTGTIDIRTDSTAFGLSTTATLYNNGTLIKSAGAGVSTINNHFRNAATLEIQTGAIALYGGYNLTHVQTAGQTLLSGGNLHLTSGAVYDVQGGDVTGSGAIIGDLANNAGAVRPGLTTGILAIDGNYNQATSATLAIELAAVDPAANDLLTITGVASLGGTLAITPINGFVPPPGATFVVLTAATLTGTFDHIVFPDARAWYVDYDTVAGTVTVGVDPVLTPGPGNAANTPTANATGVPASGG